MDHVLRIDAALGELLAPVRTAEGFLYAEGRAARPGVLLYEDEAGHVTRELVPPEELFATDSLATWGGKPVTNDHPTTGRVTPKSFRQDAVGFVHPTLDADAVGGFVKVRLSLHREDAIRDAEAGKRQLSDGKSVQVHKTPGLWDGKAQAYLLDGESEPRYYRPDGSTPPVAFNAAAAERFDSVQRKLVHNHLALVDAARAGAEARVRLDSAGNMLPASGRANPEAKMDTAEVKLGGVSFQIPVSAAMALEAERRDSAAALAKVKTDAEAGMGGKEARIAELEGEIKKLTDELGKLRGDSATVTAERDQLKADAAALPTLTEVADAVKVARELKCDEGEGAVKLDELRADSASLTTVRRAVLKRAYKTDAAKIDKADASYLAARFDSLRDGIGKAGSSAPSIEALLRTDGKAPAAGDYQSRMDAAASKRWAELSKAGLPS